MLYHLHFNEDNCPYGEDGFSHNVFVKVNESVDIHALFDEVDKIKSQMDCCDDEEGADEIYDTYCDEGWHEKIDAAIDIISQRHPEWEIETVEIRTYSTYIN